MFELLLFATNTEIVKKATHAGVLGFIVDLENKGKQNRQVNFDTQINQDTIEDLRRVRESTDQAVLCRINSFGPWTRGEIEAAVNAGTDEIFLPMVRTPREVLQTLEMIHGRCGLGILVETSEAVECSHQLAQLPLSRVYVGLNDLAISRDLDNIFISVSDGTVEQVRGQFQVPFGFGGLTLPDLGTPIPCRLLINALLKLDCQFSFLRRSFYRDIENRDIKIEIPRLLQAIEVARAFPTETRQEGWRELVQHIDQSSMGFHTSEKNGAG
ncbi:MAG: hypothetical protein AB1531_04540 [Chloroflexota bacterium]